MRLAAVLAAILPMCGPVDHPKPVTVHGSCPHWEMLLEAYNPGWDVDRMSRIMWRESNCQPEVRSRTRDTGLLQVNDVNLPWLSQRWNVELVHTQLTNPDLNVLAAAELFRFWRRAVGDGYQPWKTG